MESFPTTSIFNGEEAMFSNYYYLIQTSDGGGFSVSDACAIIAIIISVASPFITNFFSKRNAVKETFWMREVLIPQFSSILFSFIKDSPEKYKNSSNSGQFYAGYALEMINNLRESSLILGLSSDSLRLKTLQHIGDFENNLMQVTDLDEYLNLLSDFSRNVVKAIQKAQFGA